MPHGMMFAQQVLDENQDSNHDVYTMPESLFVRVANTAEVVRVALISALYSSENDMNNKKFSTVERKRRS